MLIIESLDRLARNQRDIADIYQRLDFHGRTILSVQEGRIEELHIGLKGTMDAIHLKGHRIKVKRGQTGNVREGKESSGLIYGYRLIPGQPGEWEINDEQADMIRRVYRDYASGASLRDIVDWLNGENIPTARGGRWGNSTVTGNRNRRSGLLCNPIYIGRQIYNRQSFVRHPVTGKKEARLNPESEWVYGEAPHLRIIDQDLWDTVQARKAKNKNTNGATSRRKHLLSGLMSCGSCGATMKVRCLQKGSPRFCCSAASDRLGCKQTATIRSTEVEDRIFKAIRQTMAQPEAVALFLKTYTETWNAAWSDQTPQHKADRADLKASEAAIRSSLDAIEKGLFSPALAERLAEREAEAEQLRARIAAYQATKAFAPDPGNIARRMNDALKNIDQLMKRDTRRANYALARIMTGCDITIDKKREAAIALTITAPISPEPAAPSTCVEVGSERET